jgi:hypothetical protein
MRDRKRGGRDGGGQTSFIFCLASYISSFARSAACQVTMHQHMLDEETVGQVDQEDEGRAYMLRDVDNLAGISPRSGSQNIVCT